jgi:hypothetical protein
VIQYYDLQKERSWSARFAATIFTYGNEDSEEAQDYLPSDKLTLILAETNDLSIKTHA